MNASTRTTPATATQDVAYPTTRLDPSRGLVAQWRQLNSLHGHLETAVAGALSDVGLSLVEFTVLDILQEQVNGHMRMQDVALVAGLTTGATTRLVNRLEARSLLRRVLCDYDRRGIYTELTDEGVELLSRARPRHDAAVREVFTTEAVVQSISELAEAVRPR
ncbi:MarR family transcriptional regulator [Nocardiopsis sp. ARC36]